MTDVEREAWAAVQELNRAWTTGQPERLREHFHASMQAMTPTDRHVLRGREACVEAWTRFTRAVKILSWTEDSPSVSVVGDTAIVSYCYDLLAEAGGRPVRLQGRDLFVLVREDGRWLVVADAFSEFPESKERATPETATLPRHILTILAVPAVEPAAAFYRAAFGWPARVEVPVYVEFELPDGRGLGVYQASAFAYNTGEPPSPPPRGITATEIYLHCDDLDGAIARLREAGARLLSERASRPWGDEAAYFADPFGNVLVVARPNGPA